MAARLVLADSITEAVHAAPGAWLVTGSHGGASVVPYTLQARPALAVFNDAGIGKDDAGVAALPLLQAAGIAACTVSHDSACIGQAQSTLHTGVVSRAKVLALALGLRPGSVLRDALDSLGRRPG